MNERGRQVHPALHAAGVRLDALVQGVANIDEGTKLDQAGIDLTPREPIVAALLAQHLCAGSLLILTPTLAIFLIFQRRFVAALLQGSLKG